MIRHLVVAIALIAAPVPLAAAGESEFGARMLERLRQAAPGIEMRIGDDDPLVIEIEKDGEWGKAHINLHRFHAYCRRAVAAACEASLGTLILAVTAELPQPLAPNLRVIVRDRGYLDHLLEDGIEPVYRQIGDDLFALIAFTGPNSVSVAGPDQVRALGLDDEAAWQFAAEQTRQVLPPLPTAADIVRYPVVLEDTEFLTSLLADTEAWSAIAREVGPGLVATAVSDHFVFFADLPDHPRLSEFKALVRQDCAEQDRCISPHVYRFRDGRWVIAD